MNKKIKETPIRKINKRLEDELLSAQVAADIMGFDLKTHNDPVERRFAQIEANKKGFPF